MDDCWGDTVFERIQKMKEEADAIRPFAASHLPPWCEAWEMREVQDRKGKGGEMIVFASRYTNGSRLLTACNRLTLCNQWCLGDLLPRRDKRLLNKIFPVGIRRGKFLVKCTLELNRAEVVK